MSTAQKVDLVASVQEDVSLNRALTVLELAKSTWYYHQRHKVDYRAKYAHLHQPLEQIARKHTAYGYRRTQRELRETYGIDVDKSVIQRLHQLWDLRLLRRTRSPRPSIIRQVITEAGDRANLVAQLSAIGPAQVLYTDFTELLYAHGDRKAYLMPILDHHCKVVFGWAVGPRCNRQLALQAWQQAKINLQHYGLEVADLIMHHDQDSVYTSYDWTGRLLRKDHVKLSYALNGAKDNPEMESFFGRFKTENDDLFQEALTLSDLQTIVAERIVYYNQVRRHSSLDYVSPLDFLQQKLDATQEPNGKGE